MCRSLQKIVSISFLSLFLYFVTPIHLLHYFVSHTDTIHTRDTKGLHISEAHHHCCLLQLDQDLIKLQLNKFFLLATPYTMYEKPKTISLCKNSILQNIYNAISERAPPIA